MTNASRDKNQVTTELAVLYTDGRTVVPLEADPDTHALQTLTTTDGADLGPANAKRDNNQVTVMMAKSSDGSGTPVALYATVNGALLIKTA